MFLGGHIGTPLSYSGAGDFAGAPAGGGGDTLGAGLLPGDAGHDDGVGVFNALMQSGRG